MDGPGVCHTEWSKSEREKQIPYANTYIWNLNATSWLKPEKVINGKGLKFSTKVGRRGRKSPYTAPRQDVLRGLWPTLPAWITALLSWRDTRNKGCAHLWAELCAFVSSSPNQAQDAVILKPHLAQASCVELESWASLQCCGLCVLPSTEAAPGNGLLMTSFQAREFFLLLQIPPSFIWNSC